MKCKNVDKTLPETWYRVLKNTEMYPSGWRVRIRNPVGRFCRRKSSNLFISARLSPDAICVQALFIFNEWGHPCSCQHREYSFYPQSSKNFFRCEIKQLTRWLACRETPLLSHCDIWNVSRSNAWVAETQSSFYFSHRVWYNFFVSTSSQIRLRLARD